MRYKDLDHAIQTCLALKRKFELNSTDQAHLFLAKTDLESAFRLLPVLPVQRKFLLMKAYHPVTGTLYYFVDKCLPFGARSSCYLFQEFSDAIHHIVEFKTGKAFQITNYLDFLFVETSKAACDNRVRQFLSLCAYIGFTVSKEKTEWGTQIIVFLGILLNSERLILAIPQEKRNKALHLISTACSKRKVTVKFIQSLTGTLNFLCKAIVPGRTFLCRMYDSLTLTSKIKVLKPHHHVYLNSGFIKDCNMWKYF